MVVPAFITGLWSSKTSRPGPGWAGCLKLGLSWMLETQWAGAGAGAGPSLGPVHIKRREHLELGILHRGRWRSQRRLHFSNGERKGSMERLGVK